MTQPNQQVSEWSKSLRARIHIAAYTAVGIFLLFEGSSLSNNLILGLGILFFVPAFLLFLGPFFLSEFLEG